MGEVTHIQWCDHTFSPWHGCVKVSPGCTNCYAETLSRRWGRDIWGPAKTTQRLTFGDKHWNEPLKWNKMAEREGRKHRVFCASMSDVFEDHPQLVSERARLFRLIEETPWLDWQLLTKRPENVNRMVADYAGDCEWLSWSLGVERHNIWIGTSVENQEYADKRIPELLSIPARVRFLSAEPLIGPIDLRNAAGISWVIVGGESGAGARPMDLSWVRSLQQQCKEAGIAYFCKQKGAVLARQMGLSDPKGGQIDEWPIDLRVREFPVDV